MTSKLQTPLYFFLVLLDMIGIILVRTVYALLDILLALACWLLDSRTLKNKLYAVLLIACTIPVTLLDGDATATVFVSMFAVPMFFAKKNWIV